MYTPEERRLRNQLSQLDEIGTSREQEDKLQNESLARRRSGYGGGGFSGGGGAVSSAGSVSEHHDLLGILDDDHTQYVHKGLVRTITANHAFTGQPTFSNIDINGGTINGITDLAVADGGTGQSTLDDLITLGNHTTGNYMVNVTGNSQVSVSHTAAEGSTASLSIANDSIGDTQLAYNTGQHLTSTSSPAFKDISLGSYSSSNFADGQIGSSEFVPGFTGRGWKISRNNNEYDAEFNNLTIRGTMSVYELLIQQIRATNGSIFVSSAAKVESWNNSNSQITFEDPSDNNLCPFADGDIIMMQRVKPGALVAGNATESGSSDVIKKMVYEVTAVSGRVVTVTAATGYTNSSTPSSGDEFVRIGNTGDTANRDGIVYLTADDSGAPFIDIKSSINSYGEWHGNAPDIRLGKLDGITDTDINDGNALSGFGLYSDSVYLKGEIVATSGSIGGVDIVGGSLSISSSNISDVNAYTTNQDRQTFDGLLDDSPSGTGFFMDANKLGYYTDSAWKTYMGKNGDFALAGTGGSGEGSLTWDSSTSTLTIAGSITVKNPSAVRGTLNVADGATANQSDATTNNAIAAKSKVFYQTTAPTSGHSTNDIWYDTDGGYKRYVYNGSSWVDSSDTTYDQSGLITNAQNTADAKKTTFYQDSAPTSNAVDDTWIDTNDNFKLWRATAANSNSNWEAATPNFDVNTTTIIGNTVTTGFVNALNVNANTVSAGWVYAGNLTAQQIQTAGGSFAATKNYDFRGDTNSWTVSNASFSSSTAYSTIDHTSGDARIVSPTFSPNLNGERDRYVKIRFRRQGGTGWDGRVYWNGGAGTYSDARYASIPETGQTTATSTWTTVLIDMWDLTVGGSAWQTDTAITNIRCDFGSTSSDEFDIQYIGIGDVTDTPGTFIDGDGIYTGTLNADNINAGTMTGRTVQTTGGATKLDDTSDFGDLSPPESQSGSTQWNSNSGVSVPPSNPSSIAASSWAGYGTLSIRFDLKCTNIGTNGVDYGIAKVQARKKVDGTWSDYGQPQYIDFIGSGYADPGHNNSYKTYEVNYSTQALDDAEIDNILLLITEEDCPPYSSSGYGNAGGSLVTCNLNLRRYKYIRVTQLTEINRAGFRTYATSDNYAKFGSAGSYFKGATTFNGNINCYGEAYKLVGGSWKATSDARLKNIDGKFKKGLSAIKDIDVVNYEYKHDSGNKHVGIIAQELEKALPEAVSETVGMGYEDLKIVDESPVLWTLVNAVKELSDEMDKMKKGCKCGRK